MIPGLDATDDSSTRGPQAAETDGGWTMRLALVLVVGAALLGAGACAQVQPHLSLPEVPLGPGPFIATMEGVTGAPVTPGNAVQVLLNGDEIFPAQLRAIRGARRTITYAQYVFEEGPVSTDLAQALAERCRAGVRVHVLVDGFGSLLMPAEHQRVLAEAGCPVITFRPVRSYEVGRVNHRNHRRILVVDGEVGFTGGSGASGKWMGNGRTRDHWRETDVRLEGPAVRHLQGAFAENWLEATGELLGGAEYFPVVAPAGDVPTQIVRSAPAIGSHAMYSLFMLAISSARGSILITNPYFVPDERMTEELITAASRGVRVRILLPGLIDNNIVRQASRREFGRLLEAGIELHEYRAGLLHSKSMVIDGFFASIGSTNFDNRSFALNDELNASFYNRRIAAQLERVFESDLRYAEPVRHADWKRRSLRQRMLEWLAAPLWQQL
jgi:cardiolipin synthase